MNLYNLRAAENKRDYGYVKEFKRYLLLVKSIFSSTDTKIHRIDNILYGREVDISLNNMGLGRTIFEKMKKYSKKILQVRANAQKIPIKFVRKPIEHSRLIQILTSKKPMKR